MLLSDGLREATRALISLDTMLRPSMPVASRTQQPNASFLVNFLCAHHGLLLSLLTMAFVLEATDTFSKWVRRITSFS